MNKFGQKAGVDLLLIAAFVVVLLVGGFVFWQITDIESSEEREANSPASQTAQISEQPDSEALTFMSKYSLPEQPGCPEVGTFVDVTKFAGPGGDYAAPDLTVSCSEENLLVSSNNMPLWEFVALTPNPLAEQAYSWTIPRSPKLAASPTQIGYQNAPGSTLGALGFTVSGLVWYGPTEGLQPDLYGDPFSNAILDSCGGHTGPSSEYHEHVIVTKCFFPDWAEDQVSPIVAYALDGFPIYGPTGRLSSDDDTITTFKSSYKQTGSIETYAWDNVEYVAGQGAEYLDECNGRVQPDGSYGYHITGEFPYIIGCFMGIPVGVNAGGGQQQGPPVRLP